MNIRVTSQTQTSNAIAYMRQRNVELAKYQDQLSSGFRVRMPSDDPSSFPAISQAKAASMRLGTYAQTISDSAALLNTGVSALQDMNDVLVRAKQLALEGADATNSGNAIAMEAIAVEVDGLIDRALRVANSQPDGKYLFGGSALSVAPFRVATTDAQGRPLSIVYEGADERARTLIGPAQTFDTRYIGSELFQQPGGDVFQSLISLRDTLRDSGLTGTARNQAFNQVIGAVDAARDTVSEGTAEKASNLATLEAIQNLTRELKLTTDIRTAELRETDYAEAIVRMQEQDAMLQAIYATTARLLQPGLLEFIR